MLNKSVCMKCSKRWQEIWRKQDGDDGEKGTGWDAKDERVWRDGRVYCPNIEIRRNEAIISKPPPEWCFCKLEQAVAAAMENKDANKQ